ncbi:galaxin [Astyanax mexicanus]|uniref:galaxin n=1 Tax=Astyanax mexicanus TaxID=7994 RepID=UPI0020CB3DFC|nr:galaxin [Astyanax mexicanus]
MDEDKYTCCGGTIHQGAHLSCCGNSAYNILKSSCCLNELTLGLSQSVSRCCGSQAYNPLNQICCGGRVQIRHSAQTKCCGSEPFEERTHLCCGPLSGKVLLPRNTSCDLCCGTELYNPVEQCCCIDPHVHVIPRNPNNTECCSNPGIIFQLPRRRRQSSDISEDHRVLNQLRSKRVPGLSQFTDLYCGSELYDTNIHICCSDKLFSNEYGLAQCCGAEVYQLSEVGALCCDGQLYRDQPVDAICSGKAAYSPLSYTVCRQHAYLPTGQQCCGNNTFDPEKEICCNEHRHKRVTADTTCCGSHAYSPSSGKHKCCSGHLHDLANKEEVGCCGTLLLTNKTEQRCCHSTAKTLIYDAQPGHSCCGHLYYSHSLWSCCAGRLIPEPTENRTGTQSSEDFTLRALTDYNFSDICDLPVMLGRVKSATVKDDQRFVLLANPLKIQGNKGAVMVLQGNPFVVGPLAHCRTPVLEENRTYLWRKITGKQYKPLSDITDLASPLHSITDFCNSSY